MNAVYKENFKAIPFVKWVGGKRQLLTEITSHLPKDIDELNYIEPFVGGGAVLFHLKPKNALINDSNGELINVYRVIKNNVEGLIASLEKHQNNSEYYYKIRELDRDPVVFSGLNDIEKASRIIYLNRTCFNGLFRVNKQGQFNTPFGRYKNPIIVDRDNLRAVNIFLNLNNIQMSHGDYEETLKNVPNNSFIYLDPPYQPVSESANFTRYVKGGWYTHDQIKLKKMCDELTNSGIKFLMSNSATSLIKELYSEYGMQTVKANRYLNSKGNQRGLVDELLIKNY